MPTSPTTSVIARLRRASLLRDGASFGDGELLGCFIDRRDEAALTALVQRHGPMVWGVCRRLLSHHDAEDAFQATFIVLVRKAASIVPREMVGNWLYGVAHQTALQARRTATRRRAREVQVPQMPDIEAVKQDPWAEVQPLLDQELSRLPDNYRAVIVLCDLEGRTRKEVARQLGVPEGSVAGRLARARAMLAKRLTARGVTISGGALAAVLAENLASAGVPNSVVSNAISAASSFAAEPAMATGPVSAKVASLTEGVLKAMMMSKLRAVVAVVLVLGFIVTGATFLSGRTAARGNQPPATENPAKAPPKQEKEPFIAWGKEVDGLQAGLAASAHAYRLGETMKLEVKLRNVGKAEIKITHGLLREWPPEVISDDGVRMSVYMPIPKMYKARLTDLVLKPGDTITLYKPEVAVESEDRARVLGEMLVDTPTICVGLGKYKIGYGGMVQSHPKLTTGSVKFEVQEPAVAVTAWGKEVDGLQAGLGFRPGEKRAYSHGEPVRLVVRVRNVGKEEVKFQYLRQFFIETPPTVTYGDGKPLPVPLGRLTAFGIHIPVDVNLAPGKEIELYEWKPRLRSESDEEMSNIGTLYGTGKFQIQYERVFGNSSSGQIKLDPSLSKLATGKLELEVKEGPRAAPADEQGRESTSAYPTADIVIQYRDEFGREVRDLKQFRVDDAETVAKLASHFPGILGDRGSGPRKSAGNLATFTIKFNHKSGEASQLRVAHVTSDYATWWWRDNTPYTGDRQVEGKDQLQVLMERLAAKNKVDPPAAPEKEPPPKKDREDANMKPTKIRVYIEKVNVDTSTITASCMLIGEIDGVTKPLRFENLQVSGKAKITDRGKELKLTDLKVLPRDTHFYLFLKAYEEEFGFEVVGIETIRK